MATSEIERLKEQLELCHKQQRELQAKLIQQEKYPYGPWSEVFFYPVLLAFAFIGVSGLMGVGLVKLVSLIH